MAAGPTTSPQRAGSADATGSTQAPAPPTTSARWYVAKVHRGRESALRQQLEPEGIDVFHPEIIVKKAGRRRIEPLFPSYLFFRADPLSETWVLARRAHGLKYILGPEEHPTPVDDQVMETIRERLKQWNAGGWRAVFAPGARVVVASGPLKGVEGIFVRYVPARERCKVLLATVATQHEVEIDPEMLADRSGAGTLPSLKK